MTDNQDTQENNRELHPFKDISEIANICDVQDVIGNWGKLQTLLLTAVVVINIPAAWNNLGIPFMAPNIDHWCSRPAEFTNMSTEEWKNYTIPYSIKNGKVAFSKCEMYDVALNSSSLLEKEKNKIPCTSWEYDHSFHKHTLIDKWDLVCNQSWLPSVAGSMYFSGFLISVSVVGQLSDSYGRKRMMLMSIAWSLILGIMCAFSWSFWMFAVCRFTFALGRASSFLCLYILLMELTGNKERTLVALVDTIGWDFAQMLLPGFDWLVRDWFYIQLVSVLPFSILFVCLWFAPESPRWLLSQGRTTEAEITIKRICKLNRREIHNLSETMKILAMKVTEEEEKEGGKKTFIDILKSPVLRRNSLILYALWIIQAFSYYALSFTAEDVGGNIHLFFVLSATVGIPAAFLYFYMQSKVGRKYPLVIFMIATGVTCLLAIAVPHEQSGWIIGLTVFSKFCMSVSFISVYLLATEIYPTVVRSVGLGSCSTMARIGAIIAPFMKEGAGNVHWSFPLIIIGVLTILGSFLGIFLPETKDMNLMDTLNQGKNLKKTDLTTVTTEQTAPEDIGEICGGWGRWQITLTSILFLSSFPAAYYNMGMPFLAPDIDHWCIKPAEFVNISTETWKNRSIPSEIRNGITVYSRCSMYEDYLNYSLPKESRVVVPCKFWEYDHSFYKATLTEEWDLVCERSWLSSLCSSLYFFGYLLACFISGQLSDRFGRKPVMFAYVIIAGLTAFVCMMSPNFWVFLIFRFFLAFGRASTFLIMYVFLMEIVGKNYRIRVALIAKFCWAFSQMLLPGFVWALRNWFYTELVGTLCFIILLPLWWLMPESPRWLLSKGRVDEAEIIVAKAIRTNKLVVHDLRIKLENIRKETLEESTLSDSKKVTFLHIMKTRNIRTLSFMLYFLWMVNMFAYYGLSFTADDIGGNLFLFYFLSACVEIPAALCLYYVQPKFGGRYTLAGFMMGCTLACLLALAVPKHLSPVMTTLGVIGKFSLAGSTASLYLISSEIYPTVVRNVGLGSCSTMGRVGAIVAPFMKEAAVSVHSLFPLALFGTLELIGTGLAFLLPETKNIHLADTLSQGEKIGSNTFRIIKRRAKGKADKKGSKEFTELPPST